MAVDWLFAGWQWLKANLGDVGAWASVIGALLTSISLIVTVWLRQRSSKTPAIEVHGDVSDSRLTAIKGGLALDASSNIQIMQPRNVTINQYGSTQSPPLPSEETIDKGIPRVKKRSTELLEQLTNLAREEMGGEADAAGGFAVYLLSYAEGHSRAEAIDYAALQTHLNYILAAMDWCYSEVDRGTSSSTTAADMLLRFYEAISGFLGVRGYWKERLKYGRMALKVTSRRG